jgi:phospholipid/cholesterol/gamma-HCH transport system permease protein
MVEKTQAWVEKIQQQIFDAVIGTGEALFFLRDVVTLIIQRRIRWKEVWKEVYEQGVQSVFIIVLASFATGAVMALQGFVLLNRFGAKEYVAQLVALSLVRELSPVFGSFIFSGKSGARMAAELGTMKVNDQILATRTLGVDPLEFLVVPRMVACFMVLPGLVVLSELVGMYGGYVIGIYDAHITSASYIERTLHSIDFNDFFSGFIKTFFFALIIGWVCCYQGFKTSGGSLGVGRYTTKAVALSYILVVVSNTILTKLILTFWR